MKHAEIETKYKVDNDKFYKFEEIVSEMDFKQFIVAVGPDVYFTKPDGSFLRYRKALTEKRSEVTMKERAVGTNSSIVRKEINWRVDATPKDAIIEGIRMMGYDYNFTIHKHCYIYKFKDATLVFYTVRDEDKGIQSFIEIEVDEEAASHQSIEVSMEVIKKYEEILAPVGITYRNRMNKTLFELYVKDIYDTKIEMKTFKQEAK